MPQRHSKKVVRAHLEAIQRASMDDTMTPFHELGNVNLGILPSKKQAMINRLHKKDMKDI